MYIQLSNCICMQLILQLANLPTDSKAGRPAQLNGQPAPATDAFAVNISPDRSFASTFSMPRQTLATINNVFLASPPSMQAKAPLSSSTVCKTSPPSCTRTQHLLGTSAYQTAPSSSMQIPSG